MRAARAARLFFLLWPITLLNCGIVFAVAVIYQLIFSSSLIGCSENDVFCCQIISYCDVYALLRERILHTKLENVLTLFSKVSKILKLNILCFFR